MPSFTTRRRVPFTAQEMYEVVADIERYPEFLPMCESLIVTSRTETPEGADLIATMGVGFKAIKEHFTTRVALRPAAPSIDVSYLNGPFEHLENQWRFQDCDGGSDINFFIDYKFRSPALALVMGAVFDKAFRRFAESFEERARLIYTSHSFQSN